MAKNNYRIALIPGDGIGPEVIEHGVNCLNRQAEKYAFDLQIKSFPLGAAHYLATGETLSDQTLAELSEYNAILLGAVGAPQVKPGILEKGILLKLRFALDLYINLRPVKLYPGITSPLLGKTAQDIDYVVVRENTGGLYTGVGGASMAGTVDEVAMQTMVYSYTQVERCLRYAFELAATRPRKTLALIGKSNVLTYVFDLWLRVFNEMGDRDFPGVKREYYHVDAACIFMVNDPRRFDVMVTTNMFGDILTDLGAATQGGIGLAASGNINPKRTGASMFEPIHGSAPDIAGKNLANPIATILTIKMMLDFFGEKIAADELEKAVMAVVNKDIAGLGTQEIGKRVLALL